MSKGKNIFIDTNILLDFLLKREPYDQHARNLLEIGIQENTIQISSLSVHICMYILKPSRDSAEWKNLQNFFNNIHLLNLTEEEIYKSLELRFHDFEDSLQFYTATKHSDIIVTRNYRDFRKLKALTGKKIPVYTAKQAGTQLTHISMH
jgi:predicted nucleic acid-binding protein